MAFLESLDPVTLVNLILSLTIVAVSIWGYTKLKNITPLYIGAAYVLFSISHAILLFKITMFPQVLLIIIRLTGYFLVIFGLYAILKLVMELREVQTASESPKADNPLIQNLPRIAESCGIVSSVIALICIGIQGLVAVSVISMPELSFLSKGNSFIPGPFVLGLFLVLGVCLFSLKHWQNERRISAIATALVGIVLIFSLLFLISAGMGNIEGGQVVLHAENIGIGDLIVPSVLTVLGLALTAIVLLAVRRTEPVMRDINAVLSVLVFAIGAFTIIGYAYQSPYLYGGALQPVTIASAVLFMILGIGLLAVQGTDSRLISRALDNSVQSQMMRGLIPVMVIAVLIEGWVCIVALPALKSIVNPAYMSAGIAVLSTVAISFVIAIQAGQISALITRAELERQKAEEQKQKSQALFKTMFESAGDAIMIINQEIILDTNKTAEVMFGRTRDKINGKSLLNLAPERQLDGRLSAELLHEKISAALEGETQFFEWNGARSDGTPFYTEVTLNRVKCAKKFYLQASIRDISLRKMDEQELKDAYQQLEENEEELRQQFSLLAEKEAHLQKEEEKFHTMADFTVDWEFWLAPDNTFVYVSPSCENITGYSAAEFIQDPDLMGRIVHTVDLPIFSHHTETIHGTTELGHAEFQIVRKDGEIRWISHSCRPVYGKDGTYLGRRATNSDITDRKKAEEGLRAAYEQITATEEELRHQYTTLAETEEMFRNPVEHSPVGVYLQQDGIIRYANPRFAEMFGYMRDEVLNKPFEEFVDHDDQAKVYKLPGTEPVRKTGSGSRCTEFISRKKDGTQIELEKFEAPMVFKGHPAFYGTLVDITERKKAEAAVRESEEKLRFQNLELEASNEEVRSIAKTLQNNLDELLISQRALRESEDKLQMQNTDLEASNEEIRAISETLQNNYDELAKSQQAVRESEEKVRSVLDSAAEAIYGVDLKGNCTFYNPACAKLTGYTKPDELLGKNMHTLTHHSHADGTAMPSEQCRIFQAFQKGEGTHFEDEVFWRTDGTPFPVEIWSFPQKKDGVISGMVVTFVDITERKKMENEIKTSLGEKEMLLKEIHHRVKNNMQVISSLLQLQSQSLKDEGTKLLFKESMSRIKSIALVHEQLYRSDNLSQIEYGGYLRKMFGPLFESYKADARKIAMVIEADNVMVTIEKAVPCSLIVNEMMSNSLKYAFPGDRKGEIRIRFTLDAENGNYILDYSDNGIGLPEGFVPGKTGSLGTSLINGLTRQLKGTLTMVPGPGVHYVITFPSQELRGK